MPADHEPTSGDPVAVILARMEVKLDNALTEQGKHSTQLDRHDVRISKLENRATAIESRAPKNLPAWSAVALSVLALVAAVTKTIYGG